MCHAALGSTSNIWVLSLLMLHIAWQPNILDYTADVTTVLSSSSRLQNHSQALSENKPGVYGGPLIESGPPADWHLWGVLRNGYCYLEVTDS